jgi:hypothetical protein
LPAAGASRTFAPWRATATTWSTVSERASSVTVRPACVGVIGLNADALATCGPSY